MFYLYIWALVYEDDPHDLVAAEGGCDFLLTDIYCAQNMTEIFDGFFEGDILGDFCVDTCGYYPGQNRNC